MRTITHNAAAGSAVSFYEIGNYFHLLETTGPVDIRFYKNGAIFAEASSMEGGFFSQPLNGFDAIEIASASAQTIKFAVSDGTGGYNRSMGTVTVSNFPNQPGTQGATTQAAATVTNASGTLLAARPARRLLIVQNNHATGNIFVTTGGSAATVANGIKIAPGGLIMLDVFAPVAAINAIGDIANNTAVIVVEG